MTCSIPGICSHSPDCADHNCPGRGAMNDGIDELGWIALTASIGLVVVVGAAVVLALSHWYGMWRWMV